MGEGELSGTVVTCPWHGWQYEVTTGANVEDPGIRVERHGVRVEAGDILVSTEALLG
jgi:nitrite reductase/ring-hydroxylating ferredoxin subunit